MKKVKSSICMGLMALVLCSCGGSKPAVSENYYSNPQPQTDTQPKLKKREVREVDRLAAEEKDAMRAVGIGNDFDEKEARREATRDAQATLAGYLETAIVSLTQEYHKKTTANTKKLSETQIENLVETAVSQKVSTRMIGTPEVYDVDDGSVQVYVCLELTKPTKDLLGEVYDGLSQEQVLGVDYDKDRFIKENLDRIKELRDNVK